MTDRTVHAARKFRCGRFRGTNTELETKADYFGMRTKVSESIREGGGTQRLSPHLSQAIHCRLDTNLSQPLDVGLKVCTLGLQYGRMIFLKLSGCLDLVIPALSRELHSHVHGSKIGT